MTWQFGRFRLDAQRRELRLEGREIPLQPRVFDVLVYLVRHHERVVSKDEVLETVWSDVVVSDGSLKRAVSLVRSALREGDMEDAIRTYSRQGYRFDAPDLCEEPSTETSALSDALEQARRACDQFRWAEALTGFAAADAAEALEAADLERWGEAALLAGRYADAVAPLERAVAAHGAVDDRRGVARAALALAQIHFERMELTIGRGWLRRATTVLDGVPLSAEHGMLAGLRSRFAVGEGDLELAVRSAESGVRIGRELGELDIELYAMSYLGMALIATGEIERGLAVHEEAAATVLGGSTSPLIGGLVYCGLIWTCRNRADWKRAGEWTESFTRWCDRGSIEAFSGNCRLHRAEVLHYRGELERAEREAAQACDLLAPYARGDGCRVMGDLRLAQGDLDAAEEAYRRAHQLGWDPNPGFAQLLVARGQPQAGLRSLERALADAKWANRQRRALLLARLVEVALAAGRPQRAREALAELDAHGELWTTPALRAVVLEARAELSKHDERVADAIVELRDAIQCWHSVGSQLQVARQRIALAELYLADDDQEAAELELSSARDVLQRLRVPLLIAEADRVAAQSQAKRPPR